MLFAPKEKPTEEQIAAYYAQHEGNFIRPERRVLRYASFDADVVREASKPTEEEIAERYESNAAQYQLSEKRQFSQLVVPTEAAAKAIADEVAKDTSLETAAKAKGLAVAKLKALDRADLTRQFSKGVGDAGFTAALGKIATPARSALGWHVMRVDKIASQPARSLDDVRDELTRQITLEKQGAAITERLEQIEDELDDGANLVEVAEGLEVEVNQTQPLMADGMVYGKTGVSSSEALKTVLETAFFMDLEKPQLAIVDRGASFLVFDVTDIALSAPAPLDEIEDGVRAAYILDEGSAEARRLAVQIQAEVRKGTTLRKAMASIKKRLLPPQPIRMSRPQLMEIQQRGQGVPAPLALLFQMAQGTVKVQAADGKQAWFIIKLKKIEPGKVEDDDPMLVTSQRDLGRLAGNEYGQALQRAVRNEIGVEKNKAAIRAVREQLGGGN